MTFRTSEIPNFDLASVPGGSSVFVDSSVVLTSNVQLNPDITLIFEGGCIGGLTSSTSDIVIYGNRTVVKAARFQIFGLNIRAEGDWDINEAFPEWFGAVSFNTILESTPSEESGEDLDICSANPPFPECQRLTYYEIDSSSAINKAIVMKKVGKVTFANGIYVIGGKITLHPGVGLIGTPGNGLSDQSNCRANGTIFRVPKSYYSHNVERSPLMEIHPFAYGTLCNETSNQGPYLEDLVIRRFNKVSKGDGVRIPIAISGVGSLSLKRVTFNKIPRVVYLSASCPSDRIDIQFGSFYLSTNSNYLPEGFAFDFYGYTSGINFSHNLIHDNPKRLVCLHLDNCHGASINGNIINADVEFHSSQRIAFSGNHMEYGAQIRVFSSRLFMSSNYLERRTKPSIVIFGEEAKASEVEIRENMFGLRGLRSLIETSNKTKDEIRGIIEIYKSHNEYDIALDEHSNLDIYSCFRDTALYGGFNKQPLGIMIGSVDSQGYESTGEINSLDAFNLYSWFLSFEAHIVRHKILDKNFSVPNIQDNEYSNVVRLVEFSSHSIWIGESGNYSYAYQVIWDNQRKIIRSANSGPYILLTTSGASYISLDTWENGEADTVNGEEYFHPLKGSVRIEFRNFAPIKIRLFRKKQGSSSPFAYDVYVDLHICGATSLIDNGYDVSGYRWKPVDLDSIVQTQNNAIKGLHFLGENVECTVTSLANFDLAGWIQGDKIVVLGSSTTKIV